MILQIKVHITDVIINQFNNIICYLGFKEWVR